MPRFQGPDGRVGGAVVDVKIMGPDPQRMTGATMVEQTGTIMGMTEEEMGRLANSILVLVLHRKDEGVSGGIMAANGVWARHGMSSGPIEDRFGGHIDVTRAGMVKAFLDYCRDRPEVDKLVMIDSDEDVPWDAPYRLAAWDRPIVSGVVCSYSEGRGIWACFTLKDQYNVARFPSFNFTNKIPGKGLVEAHSVGTGLVCVKKKVYEDIIAAGEIPYLIPDDIRRQAFEIGTLKYGEDTWFCDQARKLGYKSYVDCSVRAVHYKTIPISWPLSHIDYNMDPREWRVDSRDYHHG